MRIKLFYFKPFFKVLNSFIFSKQTFQKRCKLKHLLFTNFGHKLVEIKKAICLIITLDLRIFL